ncbi:dnaJ homolog subfamily C member 7-like [Macrobrachium nipponense]|uniref:dnaJ homolog subfamily C member 7-like n=1 Tax=Macrobrachium nipponense TaxID=159736 RepID=UPI0030C7BA3C
MKGNMLYKLGRLEEACECFLRVLDVADDQADYRLRLGLCLLLLGRHSEAMVQLEGLNGREDLVAAAKALQRMQRHGCPYYILGIAETANLKDIEWACRKRTLKFDPDRCQGSEEERQCRKEIMQKVNYANNLLHDAEERGEYDAVREFIKDLAAKVFQDPQEPMKSSCDLLGPFGGLTVRWVFTAAPPGSNQQREVPPPPTHPSCNQNHRMGQENRTASGA